MATSIITSINLESLPLVAKGKVREIYEANDSTLLLVASDRISAYDVILENGVEHKGAVLTLITNHWLNTVLPPQVPGLKHHLISVNIPPTLNVSPEERQRLRGRSMIVNKYRVFPVEAIVRGYITGSSWSEYQQKGTVHGLPQPSGLEQCQAFPGGPIYTPSTKAPVGEKDENITPEQARKIVGEKYADKIENLALSVYKAAHAYALERGIIVADTKFEFGLDEETDEVVLIDEVLTPDSSRFWPAADYAPGRDQKSFDKQYMRDWLTSQGLKGKEGVSMTADVQAQTSAKYLEAFQRLTGETLDQALAKLAK
ncbi:SAICAR synthase-like protein [Xylaria sp. CBS 124048]|nr:SAICAR synthase-like protein [Xylaria sp. CBS 124048]